MKAVNLAENYSLNIFPLLLLLMSGYKYPPPSIKLSKNANNFWQNYSRTPISFKKSFIL